MSKKLSRTKANILSSIAVLLLSKTQVSTAYFESDNTEDFLASLQTQPSSETSDKYGSFLRGGNSEYEEDDRRHTIKNDPNRPAVMHTFFHRIDPNEYHKYGGMTDEADADLLLTWEAAWRAAGFQIRIVTLEDAKKHPAYEKFDYLMNLDEMPFGYYDKLCFLRWLGMAAVGGGFMSDYDTFPMRKFAPVTELPHNGKLTVYDTVRSGGVPSVVSGTDKEFERIAYSLMFNTLQVGVKREFWSDMFALMDIYKRNPSEYDLTDQVIKGNHALGGMKNHFIPGQVATIRECRMVVGGNLAAHFSHFAISDSVEKGLLPAGSSAKDRPKIADDFLKSWAQHCPDLLLENYVIPE